MTDEVFKNKIIEMIKDVAAVDTLEEARAECLYSGHLFHKHLADKFKLNSTDCADIAFTLGRASQLGVLLGLLWHTNNMSDEAEVLGQKMYEDALKYGIIKWRVD